jgi:hypothetical protein
VLRKRKKGKRETHHAEASKGRARGIERGRLLTASLPGKPGPTLATTARSLRTDIVDALIVLEDVPHRAWQRTLHQPESWQSR